MKKIDLQKLINFSIEIAWELYWYVDSKMNNFYKWLLKVEKNQQKPN
jgi:hypothetical protein